MAYTAEDTKDLTDAEREALAFDDSNVTDADVVAAAPEADAAPAVAVADAKPAEPVAAVTKPADDAAPAAPDAAAAPEAAAPAAEPAAAAAPEPAVTAAAPVADLTPSLLVIAAPTDAPEKLAKIADDKAALANEFDAGDITGAEFQRRLDVLNKDERAIETAVNNANLTAQLEQNRAKQVWGAQCDAFMASDAGKPYMADKALMDQFDETVKAISMMSHNRKLPGDQILAKAHAMMNLERGISSAPGANQTTAPAAKALPKPKDPLPPTLQNVPSADVTDTGGGQFAHLDRMASNDPIGYERELAKMTDAQRDAYMRA